MNITIVYSACNGKWHLTTGNYLFSLTVSKASEPKMPIDCGVWHPFVRGRGPSGCPASSTVHNFSGCAGLPTNYGAVAAQRPNIGGILK